MTNKNEKFTKSNDDLRIQIINKCGYREFALYITLLSHRNSLSGNCFPSISNLSTEMNCSDSTIKRLITSLYKNKFIIINSGKMGINNNYYFPKESFYKKDDSVGAKRRKNVLVNDKDKETIVKPSRIKK